MIILSLLSTLSEKFIIADFNVFLINLVSAAILVVLGIFLGLLIKSIFKKLIEKSSIGKTAKRSFIELFLSIIKWSIFILFVSLALDQLGIPQLTSWLTSVLVVIPALVGALILIAIGFAAAVYLKDLISDSGIVGKEILKEIFFFFIIYVFMIFSLKTALISQDKNTVNTIIIILTAVISAAVAFWKIKIKK